MAMKHKSIEAEWVAFINTIFKGVSPVPHQLEEMKKAFFLATQSP